MIYNLDEINYLDGPNPPPWWIYYVNDKGSGEAIWYDGTLPEAHTHNLDKLNGFELQIRNVGRRFKSCRDYQNI